MLSVLAQAPACLLDDTFAEAACSSDIKSQEQALSQCALRGGADLKSFTDAAVVDALHREGFICAMRVLGYAGPVPR